ncbi:hypothetical protein C0992_007460 [Termitomyces sp. T32_za158]|nr:hypothetical protein C0992_007460 [Termitomyces sp. T32_za158]
MGQDGEGSSSSAAATAVVAAFTHFTVFKHQKLNEKDDTDDVVYDTEQSAKTSVKDTMVVPAFSKKESAKKKDTPKNRKVQTVLNDKAEGAEASDQMEY